MFLFFQVPAGVSSLGVGVVSPLNLSHLLLLKLPVVTTLLALLYMVVYCSSQAQWAEFFFVICKVVPRSGKRSNEKLQKRKLLIHLPLTILPSLFFNTYYHFFTIVVVYISFCNTSHHISSYLYNNFYFIFFSDTVYKQIKKIIYVFIYRMYNNLHKVFLLR